MTIDQRTRELIRTALAEDVGPGDVTTEATIADDARARAEIVARENGVLAGIEVALEVFRMLDPEIRAAIAMGDGSRVRAGDVVASVTGRTRAILTGERVALNFLQRLSGVATQAARYAEALAGSATRLLDTRKTTPGMRTLEKQAVVIGGGLNHRMGLWDMALIKDNHIAAAGGIAAAVGAVRAARPRISVEVEVTDLDELAQALDAGVDRVMLDNMSIEGMREAVRLVRARGAGTEIEISGGLTAERMEALADLGADFVSVGALTHSARALDLSLEIRTAE